ncbi:AGE family epimerase/isomerase [Terricaulis silvestris]|uniref:Cellobiose 2-epimerase n=1 Tax=Terricaulis silvestris TaxID=2686094 RepID=A0A6I6MT87_9CAUL|nr:AGE family epimerase/isomerase [Terricaulis silvestris]QGZ96568.1 Cellobiose 2-epimerase [Terricaulis silvestris]
MTQIPFAAIRDWIFRDALPFWAEHGVDREHGGFLEELSHSGAPTACDFKRVRVQARQIYGFSHAAMLGWAPGAAMAKLGYDYLVAHARQPDGSWAKSLSRDGSAIDPTPDLYDLAFVIFAMAWRYRASGDAEALAHAYATLDYIQRSMRAPNGGFVSKLPDDGVLLQNPHMHLTEACLAAFEASGDQRFLDQARELIGLFKSKLFDGVTLGERFGPDWTRLDSEAGRVLEPGHHFEWPWILAQHQRLTGESVAGYPEALIAFGERFGLDERSRAVFDTVWDDGAVLQGASRAWTNTERIKGWLALYELTGRDPRAQVAESVNLLFDRYFAGSKPGLWVDRFDRDGAPMAEAVPASIVYHLLLAFTEVLRLEPKLSAL